MPWFHLIEPQRPDDFRKLPLYQDRRYWRWMARAIKLLGSDQMEIPRFEDARLRTFGVTMGTFILVLTFAIPIYKTGSVTAWKAVMADSAEYVFDFENSVRRQYRESISDRLRKKVTEDEFVHSMLNGYIHKNRFIREFGFYLLMALFMVVLYGFGFFTPRRAPVYFDRKREIIYTEQGGKLYIADIGPYSGGLRGQIVSEVPGNPVFDKETSTGALRLILDPIDDKGDPLKAMVGVYPVTHAHQSIDITMFIQAFMCKDLHDKHGYPIDWNADWLKQLTPGGAFPRDFLRKLSLFTLGKKHALPEDTETQLMEYLTRPTTRDRGKPVSWL